MSTIAKRLREIADKCKRHRHQPPTSYEDGEELCRIASELETAPAEDAVPVVATVYRNGTGVFGHATLLERWEDGSRSLPIGSHRLVTEADHLSAIAALRARLNAWVKAAAETGALLPDATGMPRATASTVGLQAQIATLRAQAKHAEDVVEAAKHRIAELQARQVTLEAIRTEIEAIRDFLRIRFL